LTAWPATATPGPTPTLPPPPGPLRAGPTVRAIHFPAAPTLDAAFGDWPAQPWYAAEHVVYGAAHWEGPQDLSGTFAVGWDAAALYLAVQVTDDVYAQAAAGFNLYRGDALEIVFDADLFGDFQVPSMNADDVHLGLSPGFERPGERTEAYLWFPEAQRGPRTTLIDIAAQATDQGYQVEARIPWEVLLTQPQAGGYYGFALRISDNDEPGQALQQSMVANVPLPHIYNDPTTWGNLVLMP
ncbi:MAG: hypothetical protein GXO37_01485, partial [Chloroflexi bacterium]|nr:hypothetical protein [Chloroflexota bacterium]